jgi:hypothetical protein
MFSVTQKRSLIDMLAGGAQLKIILGYNEKRPNEKGIFGTPLSHFGPIETQHRGSLHLHLQAQMNPFVAVVDGFVFVLCKQKNVNKKINKQTNERTNKQTNKKNANKQTKQTNKTNRQTNKQKSNEHSQTKQNRTDQNKTNVIPFVSPQPCLLVLVTC